MSLSIVFSGANDGDDDPIHICSAVEWTKFVQWAKRRGIDDAIGKLARDGMVDNTRYLSLCIKNEGIDGESHNFLRDIKKYVGIGDEMESMKVVE